MSYVSAALGALEADYFVFSKNEGLGIGFLNFQDLRVKVVITGRK